VSNRQGMAASGSRLTACGLGLVAAMEFVPLLCLYLNLSFNLDIGPSVSYCNL
jgi:hypothetical protein